MRFKLFCLIFIFSISLISESKAASDNKLPFNRAQSMINNFQVMCTLELPNFEYIDAKATAMRMQLLGDNKSTLPDGAVTKSKAWGEV